jgi:hypothetical protein
LKLPLRRIDSPANAHREWARLGWFARQACRKMSQAVNGRFRQGRELKMLAALALGFMLMIWVIVIWGAAYFNQNVN